jgi:hypothetical protein
MPIPYHRNRFKYYRLSMLFDRLPWGLTSDQDWYALQRFGGFRVADGVWADWSLHVTTDPCTAYHFSLARYLVWLYFIS